MTHAGRVEAIVSESERSQLGNGVELVATFAGANGASERLRLLFDASQARFIAQARPGVAIESGMVKLELTVNGKSAQGELFVVSIAEPSLGGYSLALGTLSAEIVVKASGDVLALVRDERRVAIADQSLQLGVRVRGADAKGLDLTLAWNAERQLFTGHAQRPVSFGYLEVELRRAGGVAHGRRAEIALQPEPAHDGRLLAAGLYTAEIVQRERALCAYVYNAFGKAYPASHLKLMAALGPPERYGVSPLAWNAKESCYCATLAPGFDAVRMPLRVSLTAGERTFLGAAPAL